MLSNDGGIGFIRTQKGSTGKYKSVLMLNPFLLIVLHYKKGNINKSEFDEICSRCIDYGDTNLDRISAAADDYFDSVGSILDDELLDI